MVHRVWYNNTMTVRYDILHGGLLLLSRCAPKWEAHFNTLSIVNKREEREEKSHKPSKWLTGETERETALPLKRFETLLSHQARVITKKIDLYSGRGSSMHFVLLSDLFDRILLRDFEVDFDGAREWCWCDIHVSDCFDFFQIMIKLFLASYLASGSSLDKYYSDTVKQIICMQLL